MTKDSDGNSLKNAQDMIKLFGPEICAYYGRGCNDNAADAQVEIKKTFKRITSCWDPPLPILNQEHLKLNQILTRHEMTRYLLLNQTMSPK